jgi:lipopolysaccharide export system permease protein
MTMLALSGVQKKTVFLYILGQIVPTFLLGIFVFIFILLLFQFLKLTEFILIHNVSLSDVFQLLVNLSIGFLPIILPMSLLFSILLTYSRLSADSEMVALRALGYSPTNISLPAVFFSLIVFIMSLQTVFFLGPIAKNQFDSALNSIGSQKVMSTISEGTFSESFFDLVLYTNEIDKEKKVLKDLFVYDQRNRNNPIAIVAREGRITSDIQSGNQLAEVILSNGFMYKLDHTSHTKIKFENYSLIISSAITTSVKEKDHDNLTFKDLMARLDSPETAEQKAALLTEYHGRFAIATSCLLFGFLGSALGARVNRRSSASSGFIVSVICIISYWLLYVTMSNFSKKLILPPQISLWIPNILFLLFTLWVWRKHAQT